MLEFAKAFRCLGTEESMIPINGGTIAPPKNNNNHRHSAPNQNVSVKGTGAALMQQREQYKTHTYKDLAL